MLDIVSNNNQIIGEGSTSYQKIEIVNQKALLP